VALLAATGTAGAAKQGKPRLPGADYKAADAEPYRGWPVLEILLQGNRRIRDEAVLRELYLQPGDAFDPELLQRDLRFLEGLSVFAAVGVAVTPDGGRLRISYFLMERGDTRWGLVYPVADYRDGEVRLGAVYRHRSLLGAREDLWLEYSAGWEERARVSIGRPWLGRIPIDHRLDYRLVDRDDDDELHTERVALSAWISLLRRRPLEHRCLLSVAWGERSFLATPVDGLGADRERHYEQFSSLSLGYARDTRDSFLRPRRGGQLELTGTLYDPLLGSTVYLRQLQLYATRFRALPANWVGAVALDALNRWGGLFYKGVSSLGGLDSVRGYGGGSIDGWVGADSPAGPRGRHHLVLRSELRHDLLPRFTLDLPVLGVVDVQLEGLVFADAGFLWSRDRFLLPDGARARVHGGGAGLRAYTPVGDVLRVELGVGEAGRYKLQLGSGMRF
jgi:outer membrane translocation and assembly module TamA